MVLVGVERQDISRQSSFVMRCTVASAMYIVAFLLLQYPASSAFYTNVCLNINSFGIEGLRNKFTRGIFTATSSPSSLTSLNLWKKYEQNNDVGTYSSIHSLMNRLLVLKKLTCHTNTTRVLHGVGIARSTKCLG